MAISKNAKLLKLIHHRLRITLSDGRTLIGQLLAFDHHMNMVLGECEEFRKIRPKNKAPEGATDREEKRVLGLTILRGETIVAMSIEAPPPPSQEAKIGLAAGPGLGRPAGRGLPMAPPVGLTPAGLSGPVRGVGTPAPGFRPGMPPPPGFRPGGPPPPPPGFRPPPGGMPPRPGFPMGAPPPPPGFRPPQ